MRIIISFVPWIAYGVLNGPASWSLAATAGAVLALLVTLQGLRTSRRFDLLNTGTLAFFAVLALGSPWFSGTFVEHYTEVISQATIATLMWSSIVVRRPFTETYAIDEVPAEVVGTPIFRHSNNVISAIWAISFTVATAAMAVLTSTREGGSTFVMIASIVVPIFAMRWYIARVEKAAEAADGAEAPAPVAA